MKKTLAASLLFATAYTIKIRHDGGEGDDHHLRPCDKALIQGVAEHMGISTEEAK